MRLIRTISMCLILILTTHCLYADVVPGRWEKVEKLEKGTSIIITLDTGDALLGEFILLEEGSIRIAFDGLEREYPKSSVKKVIQLKKGWSRGQKAALGAAIGFPAGLGIGYGIGSAAWGRGEEAGSLGFVLGVLLGGTLTIAGLIDEQTYEEVVIYKSVT